jgi:hypothetical protein
LQEKDKIYNNITKKQDGFNKIGNFDKGRLLSRNYCPTEIQTIFKIYSELTNK